MAGVCLAHKAPENPGDLRNRVAGSGLNHYWVCCSVSKSHPWAL